MLPSLKPISGVVRVCVCACVSGCVCSALVKVWLLSPLLHRDGDIPTLENKGKHLTKHHSLFHFAVVVLCCSCCRLWLSNNFSDLFSVFLKELICQCLLANQTLYAVLQTHKTLTAFLQIPPKLFWKIFFYFTFFLIPQNYFIPTVKRTCCWPDIKKRT